MVSDLGFKILTFCCNVSKSVGELVQEFIRKGIWGRHMSYSLLPFQFWCRKAQTSKHQTYLRSSSSLFIIGNKKDGKNPWVTVTSDSYIWESRISFKTKKQIASHYSTYKQLQFLVFYQALTFIASFWKKRWVGFRVIFQSQETRGFRKMKPLLQTDHVTRKTFTTLISLASQTAP